METIAICSSEEVAWHDFEVFWALDCASPLMLGTAVAFPSELEVRVIDHHHTNRGWGTFNHVDPGAASATAVLFELFTEAPIPIDATLATSLLTGLATDTSFFTMGTDTRTFRMASELIDLGANLPEIAFQIRAQARFESLRLAGDTLQAIQTFTDPPMAVLVLHASRWPKDLLLDPPDFLTHQVRTVAGTDFGVVIIEEAPGMSRLELKARTPGFDVSAIASALGGGGHQARAGVRQIAGSINEVIARIRQAANNLADSKNGNVD